MVPSGAIHVPVARPDTVELLATAAAVRVSKDKKRAPWLLLLPGKTCTCYLDLEQCHAQLPSACAFLVLTACINPGCCCYLVIHAPLLWV
jgi:hypothetical protein